VLIGMIEPEDHTLLLIRDAPDIVFAGYPAGRISG
jgi:hypothetical protein